ncbi:glycosyltransferase [Chromobacterium haemolyticum]|nr:glycosyltransferase [Chromobacterium haemolyticum]
MKRLAIIRQKYNPAGGAERIVSAIVKQLQAGGEFSPLLISRNWESLPGVDTVRVKPFYLGSVWRDWSFARAARAAWRQAGADLVQSHERIPGCHVFRAGDGVHAAWLDARLEGAPWWRRLSTFCNPYHHFMLRTERAMFQHPALRAVICNSELVRDDVMGRFGVDPRRCTVIRNGVDSDFFNQSGGGARAAGSAARAIRHSTDSAGVGLCGLRLRAQGRGAGVARHRAPCPVHLVVVGGDKKLARYQRLATQLGVSERTHFTGPQRDVRSHYGLADGFILPTLYEPFGSVVIEAMACGLPVLTSTRCGGAELLEPGVTGWLAEAGDAATWQDNVAAWLAARARLAA